MKPDSISRKAFLRWLCLGLWLLQTSILSYAQTAKPDARTASISGRVTVAGKPAVNAQVTAFFRGDGDANFVITGLDDDDNQMHQTRTDGEGRYEITGLAKGKYQLSCLSELYVQQTATGLAPQARRVHTLDEGEALKNMDFALVRGGVITGRVTDADGKPVIEEQVRVRFVSADGKPSEREADDWNPARRTDDRGIYRLYGLTPGHYRVSVGEENWSNSRWGDNLQIPLTYHPDATTEAAAKLVEVKSGGETENIDIRVGHDENTYFSASGKVLDADTGQPFGNSGVSAYPWPAEGSGFNPRNGDGARVDAQGNFTMSRLRPGHYRMRLDANTSFLESTSHYSEPLSFTITDGDVAGLEFKVRRGATISGTAVLDNAAGNELELKAALTKMLLFARTASTGNETEDMSGFGGYTQIKPDGSFRFAGVKPGRILIQSQSFMMDGNAAPRLTLLRVEKDGAALNDGLQITGAEQITGVRLVFTHGTGSLRGTVQITNGTLPAGYDIHIYAKLKNGEKLIELTNAFARVDDKGRFAIQGLIAGEYALTISAYYNNGPDQKKFPPLKQTLKETVIVTANQPAQANVVFDLSQREEK